MFSEGGVAGPGGEDFAGGTGPAVVRGAPGLDGALRREGDVGQKGRVSAGGHRIRRGSWKCVEIPVYMLQKWGR